MCVLKRKSRVLTFVGGKVVEEPMANVGQCQPQCFNRDPIFTRKLNNSTTPQLLHVANCASTARYFAFDLIEQRDCNCYVKGQGGVCVVLLYGNAFTVTVAVDAALTFFIDMCAIIYTYIDTFQYTLTVSLSLIVCAVHSLIHLFIWHALSLELP